MQIVTPSIKISPPKAKSRLSPPAFCFLIFCFVHGLLIVTLPIVHEFCIFPPQSSCIIIIAEGKPLQDNNSIHKISPPKAKSRLSPPAFCFFGFRFLPLAKNMRFRPGKRAGTDPLRAGLRAAKPAKCKNLWVFIRFDAHPPGGLLLPCGVIHLVSSKSE
mgnify:CR=1 FL=1